MYKKRCFFIGFDQAASTLSALGPSAILPRFSAGKYYSTPLLLFIVFLHCSSFLVFFFLPFLIPFPYAELVIRCSFSSIHWVFQGVSPGLGIPFRYSSLREYQVIAKHPECAKQSDVFLWSFRRGVLSRVD